MMLYGTVCCREFPGTTRTSHKHRQTWREHQGSFDEYKSEHQGVYIYACPRIQGRDTGFFLFNFEVPLQYFKDQFIPHTVVSRRALSQFCTCAGSNLTVTGLVSAVATHVGSTEYTNANCDTARL